MLSYPVGDIAASITLNSSYRAMSCCVTIHCALRTALLRLNPYEPHVNGYTRSERRIVYTYKILLHLEYVKRSVNIKFIL